jgi:hypothetical protein
VTEPAALTGYHLVEAVDEPAGASRSQQAPEGTRQPDLREQRHATSGVARNGSAVAKDEPPALVARCLRHRRQ